MRLKPRNDEFFDMFSTAAANVHEGARVFHTLTQEYDRLPELVKALEDIEHKGDCLTHDIIFRLNKSFITPLDREDIIAIASRLDSVVDFIYGTADRMLIYRVSEVTRPIAEMAQLLVEATDTLCKAFEVLPSGKYEDIRPLCVEINRVEDVADGVYRQSIGDLLLDETANPLEVIKLKEVIEHLESCADMCEDVADILEGVIIKHA